MKIAMHMDGPSIRGNEKQSTLLAGALKDRGHQVVVSCRGGGAVEALLHSLGVATTPVRPRGDADLFHALRFAAMLRAERPDAVLLTSWKRALIAAWAARVAGVPRVVLRVGGVHDVPAGIGGWKYRLALTRGHHRVVVNSRAVADHLRAVIPGLEGDRVHLVPNAVQLTSVPAGSGCAALDLPHDAPLLVSVGGLDRHKGFDTVIAALGRLDIRARLVIVGEGPDRERLLALAGSLGLADRVHLIGHRAEVAPVLAAADLFVLASRGEGMAVAMLEAAMAGLPIVSTEVGGVWELLEPREGRPPGGWVVPVGDADALARALREVLSGLRDDPASVSARVDEARWRLDHWFTLDAMVDGYEAVLAGSR